MWSETYSILDTDFELSGMGELTTLCECLVRHAPHSTVQVSVPDIGRSKGIAAVIILDHCGEHFNIIG